MPPSFGVSSLCMSVAHRPGWPQGRTLSYVCSRRLWQALLRTSCHSSFVSVPPEPSVFLGGVPLLESYLKAQANSVGKQTKQNCSTTYSCRDSFLWSPQRFCQNLSSGLVEQRERAVSCSVPSVYWWLKMAFKSPAVAEDCPPFNFIQQRLI